jgi:glutathione S-transferase
MKLYFTPTSPYVRKVMVFAHEAGLESRIETMFLRPLPMKADPTLSLDNPLSKIPTLVTDEGLSVFDSAVICEYLDALQAGPKLIPQGGPERWRVLKVQALTDGILEAAILVFYEKTLRPEALHWPDWIDGQTEKVNQSLDLLELEAAKFQAGAVVDLAQVCAGVTIGWLDFRKAFGDVLEGRPTLKAWFDGFRVRASMKATEPHT